MIHADDIIDFQSKVRQIVKEEVEMAALASAGQSPPIYESSSTYDANLHDQVQFDDDFTVTAFKINDQWIEISRLINMFNNIGKHADFIYENLRDQNHSDELVSRVITTNTAMRLSHNRKSAMRKSVTMRDSAKQMAKLLDGESLEPKPEFEEGEID